MKIKVENIEKQIKGNEVLKNVSFEFESGKVYGIYGRNGSGKTMLMRSILGLINLDSGKIMIDEDEIGKDIDFPQSVGAMIENPGFFPYSTGYENLKLLAEIKNIIGEQEIREMINKVGLDDKDKRTVSKYSLGMRQRLAIAQAVMEKPKLLVLDEPTNALDEELLNSNVKTIDDVANKSDLIVKVKISDEKIIEDADIKTKVKVEKIIKSDGRNIKKGDDIYIYEMINFSNVDDSIMTNAKYNYLDTGKEYYLCLNSLKTIKGYKKSEEEKKTYMYSTNYYSVYSASKEQKVVKLSKKKIYNEEYKYRDLKDQVILTSDKKVVDDYNKMSESFAQKYMN